MDLWIPRRHRAAVQQLIKACGQAKNLQRKVDLPVLTQAFIVGFPSRIGQVRPDRQRVLLASGSEANLKPNQGSSSPFLVALDLHTMEKGKTYIGAFLEISVDALTPHVKTTHRMVNQRVQAFREEHIGAIVLSQHNTPVDPAVASNILLESAQKNAVRALNPNPSATRLMARLQYFARNYECPINNWKDLLPGLCLGRSSFKELQQLDLVTELQQALPWDIQQNLKKRVPESIKLPSGSHSRLEYPENGPPILTARIQQLFGLEDTPRINGEPIRVHLTAPNNRPQQQTRDLASFWRESYPMIRKELRGRYPKHAWPETPTKADAQDRPKRRKKN